MRNKIGTAVNIDGDYLYHIYRSCDGDVTNIEETLRSYIRGYAGKGISDLLINCFTQMSMYPSKTRFFAGDKFDMKEENGIPVDYTDNIWVRSIKESHEAAKQDPLEVMLEESKKCNMRTWISVRMNDAHLLEQETSFLRGTMYYEAVKRDMVIGEEIAGSYFARCQDYGYEYIREKMFDYLSETVDRYDMDGLELDFQRDIFCFNYIKNPDCHKIMTEFIKKLRALLKKKEQERGHAILLGVRVVPDIAHNKIFGFDVEEWVKMGLVDVLVPTPRWEVSDSTMDISSWKELVKGTDVEIYAGIEWLLALPVFQSVETVKGFAAQYLAAGADKIYLFNYFRCRAKDMHKDDFKTEEAYQKYLENEQKDEFLKENWENCASSENCQKGIRRHVMTHREDCMVPLGEAKIRPLPSVINGEKVFSLETGDCQSRKVTLYVGVKKGEKAPEICVDGMAADCLGNTEDAFLSQAKLVDGAERRTEKMELYAYAVTAAKGNKREILVKGNNVTVNYLEMKIE